MKSVNKLDKAIVEPEIQPFNGASDYLSIKIDTFGILIEFIFNFRWFTNFFSFG